MRALLAIVLFVLAAAPAHAAMCGTRMDFVRALNDKYQERVKSFGVAGGNLVEVFTSKVGTWTFLVTTPDGKSCVMAAGNSWEELPPEIIEKKT